MIVEEYKANKQGIANLEALQSQLLEAQKEIHHKLRILCRDAWDFYKRNLPKDYELRIRNWNDTETTYTAHQLKMFDVLIYGLNTPDGFSESGVGVGEQNVNFQVFTAPITKDGFQTRSLLRVAIPIEKFEANNFKFEDFHLGY